MAQKTATAVMNVSVTVISGTQVSDIHNLDINFDEHTVEAGSFEITTAKNVETSIQNEPTITLTNQFGDEITVESDSTLLTDSNTHKVNVGAKLDPGFTNLRGMYSGTITTTIAYF